MALLEELILLSLALKAERKATNQGIQAPLESRKIKRMDLLLEPPE